MNFKHTPITLQGYREKATEIRAAAETMREPAKSVMLRLAASYDTLAGKVGYVDTSPITRSRDAD